MSAWKSQFTLHPQILSVVFVHFNRDQTPGALLQLFLCLCHPLLEAEDLPQFFSHRIQKAAHPPECVQGILRAQATLDEQNRGLGDELSSTYVELETAQYALTAHCCQISSG